MQKVSATSLPRPSADHHYRVAVSSALKHRALPRSAKLVGSPPSRSHLLCLSKPSDVEARDGFACPPRFDASSAGPLPRAHQLVAPLIDVKVCQRCRWRFPAKQRDGLFLADDGTCSWVRARTQLDLTAVS